MSSVTTSSQISAWLKEGVRSIHRRLESKAKNTVTFPGSFPPSKHIPIKSNGLLELMRGNLHGDIAAPGKFCFEIHSNTSPIKNTA